MTEQKFPGSGGKIGTILVSGVPALRPDESIIRVSLGSISSGLFPYNGRVFLTNQRLIVEPLFPTRWLVVNLARASRVTVELDSVKAVTISSRWQEALRFWTGFSQLWLRPTLKLDRIKGKPARLQVPEASDWKGDIESLISGHATTGNA
jgi:hypothetical protein